MDLFIPYEEAKALNNEDYDKVTRFGQDASLYDEDGDHVFYANYGFMGSGLGEGYIPAPTWDEVSLEERDCTLNQYGIIHH
jgi:hypothetical protein